jgi:DNA-binding IclR family transcriptional regulator
MLDIGRPLIQAVADAHRVSVYLSKVLGPSAMLLLDWVGGLRPDPHVTVGRPHPSPGGASGVILGAFGESGEVGLETRFARVKWYQRPSFTEFLTRVTEARAAGFAVDRGSLYRDVTLVSVPVLSPTWELLLILTAAGHPRDLDDDAVAALSRALQAAAARLSDSLPLLRLG